MKLIDKKAGEQNYLQFYELLANVPFICDTVESKKEGTIGAIGRSEWLPYISDAKKFLLSRDDRGIIYTDGTTMVVDAKESQLRFLNVQYVEVLEVVYVGVDG